MYKYVPIPVGVFVFIRYIADPCFYNSFRCGSIYALKRKKSKNGLKIGSQTHSHINDNKQYQTKQKYFFNPFFSASIPKGKEVSFYHKKLIYTIIINKSSSIELPKLNLQNYSKPTDEDFANIADNKKLIFETDNDRFAELIFFINF